MDILQDIDWDIPDLDAQHNVMVITTELLDLMHQEKIDYDSATRFRELLDQLYSLRVQAPHEVNQGLRSLMNLMANSNYREFVIAEMVVLINNVAFSVLNKVANVKNDSIDTCFGNHEDVLMEAWAKVIAKQNQCVQAQNKLNEDLEKDVLKGIFNPLAGDFLSWFARIVGNKARDYIKMSSRKRLREKRWNIDE